MNYSINRDQIIELLKCIQFYNLTSGPNDKLESVRKILIDIYYELSKSDYNSLIICKH